MIIRQCFVIGFFIRWQFQLPRSFWQTLPFFRLQGTTLNDNVIEMNTFDMSPVKLESRTSKVGLENYKLWEKIHR